MSRRLSRRLKKNSICNKVSVTKNLPLAWLEYFCVFRLFDNYIIHIKIFDTKW